MQIFSRFVILKLLLLFHEEQNPDGILKLRKLRKLVLGSLRESGFIEDESQLADMLEQKVNPSDKMSLFLPPCKK